MTPTFEFIAVRTTTGEPFWCIGTSGVQSHIGHELAACVAEGLRFCVLQTESLPDSDRGFHVLNATVALRVIGNMGDAFEWCVKEWRRAKPAPMPGGHDWFIEGVKCSATALVSRLATSSLSAGGTVESAMLAGELVESPAPPKSIGRGRTLKFRPPKSTIMFEVRAQNVLWPPTVESFGGILQSLHESLELAFWSGKTLVYRCTNHAQSEEGVKPTGKTNESDGNDELRVVEGLSQMTLPQLERITGELTSTKQIRIAASAISHADRSIGRLCDAVIDRYEELDRPPTGNQIKRLLELCTREKLKSIYKNLQRELGVTGTATNTRAFAETSLGKVSRLSDIDRAKELFLKRLVFKEAKPTKEGFIAWFESVRGREVPTRDEKRAVAAAISHFCRRYDLVPYLGNRPVSISGGSGGGGRGEGTFVATPVRGASGAAKSTGQQLPADMKLK